MLEKFRRKYIGDRNFYRRYIALALPMIIQNAVTNLVSFLDNIMVGQLGTEQMSGVAIVNQLIFVYNLAVFGAVSAASIFGAQYFGKGNHKGHMYSFRFKRGEPDFSLSHGYFRKWCDRCSIAVWITVSDHYDGRTDPLCCKSILCDQY